MCIANSGQVKIEMLNTTLKRIKIKKSLLTIKTTSDNNFKTRKKIFLIKKSLKNTPKKLPFLGYFFKTNCWLFK